MAGHSDLRRNVSSKAPPVPHYVDIIDFVHTPLWKDKDFLTQKYLVERRSIAQIAAQIVSSRATVRKALIEFGIKTRQRGKPGLRPAQVPYGYRMVDGLMIPHQGEQKVLSVVQKMNAKGLSLRQICEFLTSIGVPTKRRGQRWHPEMVRRLLQRSDRVQFSDKN
jgi:hypothetical protein